MFWLGRHIICLLVRYQDRRLRAMQLRAEYWEDSRATD